MPSKTRTRLIDAVLLSVREHGYAGTSMQDLLRATKVSSSSMYHFFPGGKEELVASAVRHSGLEAAEQITQCLQEYEFTDAIEVIFDATAADMESRGFKLGCPIGVPATEAAADSEQIQAAVAEVFGAWAAAYASAAVEAGMGKAEAARVGRFIVATYEGTVALARCTRSTQPYRDAVAVITQYVDQS